MTSIGNVATQPAMPAIAAARKRVDHGVMRASESISDSKEVWSV